MTTVLVTGANRGIGLALARQFLRNGDRVLACCRKPSDAQALMALSADPGLSVHPLEVRSQDSVDELARSLSDVAIDVVLNNAGTMGGGGQTLDDMDYDAWIDAFNVNTLAPFRVISALLPNLRRSSNPRVVTLSSQMGSLARKSTGSHAYRSSKAAVNKVMQVLALELESDGIVVCPVHPGWVRTDMGGDSADISAEESAAGIVKLIAGLGMEHSGRFWTWQGEEHPW